jgi:hypothetical protein
VCGAAIARGGSSGDLELLSLGGDLPLLELEAPEPAPPKAAAWGQAATLDEDGMPDDDGSSSIDEPARAGYGAPLAEAPIHVDPVEAQALADYGRAPEGLLGAAPYAARVLSRRRVLKPELARRAQALAEAERVRDQALAAVVERLKAKIAAAHPSEPLHPAAALLEKLRSFDDLAQSRGASLQAASAQYAQEAAKIDAQIAEKETERARVEGTLSEAQVEESRCREIRTRGEAKVKRVDIEMRAANEAARSAAGPNATSIPPEHAARLQALQTERDARASELVSLVSAHEHALSLVSAREAAQRDLQRSIAGLRTERRRFEQSSTRQLEIRSAGVEEAERQRLASYAEVALELFARFPRDVSADDRARVEAAKQVARDRETAVELYRRAIDSADPDVVKKGIALLAGSAGLVVLIVVLVVAKLASSPDAPVAPAPTPATSVTK